MSDDFTKTRSSRDVAVIPFHKLPRCPRSTFQCQFLRLEPRRHSVRTRPWLGQQARRRPCRFRCIRETIIGLAEFLGAQLERRRIFPRQAEWCDLDRCNRHVPNDIFTDVMKQDDDRDRLLRGRHRQGGAPLTAFSLALLVSSFFLGARLPIPALASRA
jgi:hypothetical protein